MYQHDFMERRHTDPVQKQIEELILSATDPKDKAFLLIMNKMAISLDTNNYLTQGLSDEFKTHTEVFKKHEQTELAMINQGKGGLRVAVFLLGFIQTLAGFIIYSQLAEIKEMKSDLITLERTIFIHTEQLKTKQIPNP